MNANALTRRVIPCLDVTNGRVVKGIQFLDLRDAGDPVELAAFYNGEGADELVFLDITASSDSRDTMIDVVERTASQIFIPLTVGGGVRVFEDVKTLLRSGADKVSINTAAVERPGLLTECAEAFGAQCVVVAIDAKREGNRWTVWVSGGKKPTGLDAVEWAKEAARRGAGEILLTSIDRDGTNDGFDLELTRTVAEAVSVPVIASGGAGNAAHMAKVLTEGKAAAALAAGMFHRNETTVRQVKESLRRDGIGVRL
ncbi:MAG: imidazole glycerol phosphate synthase subunit HisF [Planctomycetes bacterium]|nr:imidazole glycerol phosphate synthase subunit HisF [Planctomycetota bacterium]